ncbi:M20 family metallopeptidase [Actinomadura vinacea]|uniref:M20 family metallopeptidase n=1 Tax=Actinomadura vinacea TaxID=115336 RepID=A0ABN3K0B0_9ACTN
MTRGADAARRATAMLDGQESQWPELSRRYRWLHEHPEPSMGERETAAALAGWLREAGYEVTEHVGGTGVVGVLRNGPGPTVLLRGDMDALPVEETSGLPYASRRTATLPSGDESPMMHACGHDMHVASLLGTAQTLASGRAGWSGTVVVCGQPGEETAQGARAMVEDGLMTRFPRPDVCLAQHVSSAGDGIVEHRAGVFMSASASIELTVHGRGGHASQPEVTIDPVLLGSYLVTRLQAVVSRETTPSDPAVLSVSMFHAGAQANVIPDDAVLTLNLRARSEERKAKLIEAVRRIAAAECASYGAPRPPTLRIFSDFPALANDPALVDVVGGAHSALPGTTVEEGHVRMGSEDFSEFGLPGPGRYDGPPIPYVYWCYGLTDPDVWDAAPGRTREERMAAVPVAHTGDFVPRHPERTLRRGVELLLAAALCFL